MSRALRSLFARAIGAAVFLCGIWMIIASLRFDPNLSGFMVASSFGTQTFSGNIISFLIYAIGFVPMLFLFLYIARVGGMAALGQGDEQPELNSMRAFLTIVFGAFAFGMVSPNLSLGGIAGVVAAADIVRFVGAEICIVLGVIFMFAFLLLGAMLLHIKFSDLAAAYRGTVSVLKWVGTALHLRPAPETDEIEEYEEEDEEEEEEEIGDSRLEIGKNRSVHRKPKQSRTTNRQSRISGHDFELPSPSFLAKSVFSKMTVTPELKNIASAMEASFEQYGVLGRVAGIKPGPIITLYEFEPADGIRVADITKTVTDMTRAMATEKIRIAPIPRTKYIGVEMVNLSRATVRFQSMMSNPEFIESPLHIPLALGVDIGGAPRYYDLAKMPHVLIAGRTGSGKSVFVQSIIMSIVYHFTPNECKLIIVDPKGVDFTLWHDIPHLAAPIVTDANQAVNVLKWAVREMEDRYSKLKKIGAQNIEAYNEAVGHARESGQVLTEQAIAGTDPETGEIEYEEREIDLSDMPYLAIIIDEVADLMSVARKEVEASIQRLAQKARAAGIHLVAATQRPDVSVITGVIKANFPTRISFQARSAIDSGTTLGEKGAEQLLPFGDMLFSEAGRIPVRIHGALIENSEINKVANFLRAQGEPDYVDGVLDGSGDDESAGVPRSGRGMTSAGADDMYAEAVEIVTRDKKPTISYIQRRLGIGYNKAATIIERMEAEGIVSAPDGNNKRHLI
jgi:S-DNA-T family DNA segregation ATPase FtsK/SpoIIIE